MPEVKSTFQLTNLNFDVPQGPRFRDHFGDQNDGLINVCGGNGQKQLIRFKMLLSHRKVFKISMSKL